jgi:tetratricopeptide (TPR) repeat protein
VNGAQNPQVATANSEPAVETAKAEAQLTTEQGVELYKLAAVVPPPYTFSGLVAKGKLPDAHDKGKYSSGSTPSDTGRQLFQNAMAGYVEGRYGEAVSFLESAVQKEPKAADVNFYLGVCKLLLGHPQESIAPLKQAVAAGNSPYLQSSHYYLAKAYLQQEKFEEAEGEFHDAATISGRLTSEAKSLLARTQAFRAQLDKK